jgi:hypothetical protein
LPCSGDRLEPCTVPTFGSEYSVPSRTPTRKHLPTSLNDDPSATRSRSIRVTDELRARVVEQPPTGYMPMLEATKILGVSRQTVLQRVKRGELDAVHVRLGRRKGLRMRVPEALLASSGPRSTHEV